jgi:peroxiredoxin
LQIAALLAVCVLALAPGAAAEEGPRPFLGVRMDTLASHRVRVTSVLPGSAAAAADIRRGDIIAEVAGRPIGAPADVAGAVGGARPGARVAVVLDRSGARVAAQVVLGVAPRDGEELRAFVGHPAPAWRLSPVDGSAQVELAALRGRVVLVYFWSVHCGACRMATPEVNRLEQAHSAQGLSVVAVSDDDLTELRSAPATRSLSVPLLHDLESKVGTDYWIGAFPTFFVIDRQGRVAWASAGWDGGQAQSMQAVVARLLALPAP